MNRVWRLSLIIILTVIFLSSFGNLNLVRSAPSSIVQSQVTLQTAIAKKQELIQTMLQESAQFKFTPCGKNTACYLHLQTYTPELEQLNQLISRLGNKSLVWQDGITGLIDPRQDANGTLSQYRHSRDRQLLQGRIINSRLSQATASQSSPRAILTMGGPGSGKSTILKMFAVCSHDFVQIDADDLKQDLFEYQLAIAVQDRLASSRVHEESSLMAKQIRDRAIKERRHLCLDGTLANKEKALALIDRLKNSGYEVTIIGALIPYEVAQQRIAQRAEITGRFIPPEFVRQAYINLAQYAEVIAKQADFAYLYDNNVPWGDKPRLVGLFIRGIAHFRHQEALPKTQL